MTVLIAGIACTLSFLLAGFFIDLGDASTARARAQSAADAAALAAASESGPYGSASPAEAARRFAELNGASLIACICVPGELEAQVSVESAGVVADARAVLEPDLLAPQVVSIDGLQPVLAWAVDELIGASEGRVSLVSGWRSTERQAELWADALVKYGSAEAADDWVAPPGHSMHERGLAVDLGGDLELAARLVAELDLPMYRPMAHEPHHFELVGSR